MKNFLGTFFGLTLSALTVLGFVVFERETTFFRDGIIKLYKKAGGKISTTTTMRHSLGNYW